ncbi:MAG TPA: DUF1585 domain-containing protein [Verrucomicrobia bacterium]|nr:DUF1585 domain-containing protein [Verrucomicrobiota bacterium]
MWRTTDYRYACVVMEKCRPRFWSLTGQTNKTIVRMHQVRISLTKFSALRLLIYANGVESGDTDFAEVEKILAKSAENDYRIIDIIAAVLHSPLFREEK